MGIKGGGEEGGRKEGEGGLAHRDENIVLSVGVEIRDEIRKLAKSGCVVREVQVVAHVVNVIPLCVLCRDRGKREGEGRQGRRKVLTLPTLAQSLIVIVSAACCRLLK